MNLYRCPLLVLTVLASVALIAPVFAADPHEARQTQKESTATDSENGPVAPVSGLKSWSRSVSDPLRSGAADSSSFLLNFRTIEIPGYGLAGYRNGIPAFSFDVSAQLENCADGNVQFTSLNIGGLPYDVQQSCQQTDALPDFSGKFSSERPPKKSGNTNAPVESAAAKPGRNRHVIHCDPASWSCRTVDP